MESFLAAFAMGAVNWALAILTGSALIIGIGALVYSRLPALPYRTLAWVAGGLLLFVAGWTGHAVDMRDWQERQALLAENRKLVAEITAASRRAATLEADARTAVAHARDAEDRARRAEEVAATLSDTATVSAPTSHAIRNLWGQ